MATPISTLGFPQKPPNLTSLKLITSSLFLGIVSKRLFIEETRLTI
jgi:hypothetical protein